MMAENSKIEWTDHTFNPWIGCTAISPACDHCYAETLVKRRGGDFSVRRRTAPANWRKPLQWDRKAKEAGVRYKVFCASLADVFDNAVPDEWRADLFALIAATPNLDWLLLTKRPQNIVKMLPVHAWDTILRNIWLGTTVENQEQAAIRIPYLLSVHAAVHFVSVEPLLGPVNLHAVGLDRHRLTLNALTGYYDFWQPCGIKEAGERLYSLPSPPNGNKIDWVIVGGESGPGARPMHPDWVAALLGQCLEERVPFFFKQWGEYAPGPPVEFMRVFGHQISSDPNGDSKLMWAGRGAQAGAIPMRRVGKKAAGAFFYGTERKEFPVLPIR